MTCLIKFFSTRSYKDEDFSIDPPVHRVYPQLRDEPKWIQERFLEFQRTGILKNCPKVQRKDINKLRESGILVWSRVTKDYIVWFVEDESQMYEDC